MSVVTHLNELRVTEDYNTEGSLTQATNEI